MRLIIGIVLGVILGSAVSTFGGGAVGGWLDGRGLAFSSPEFQDGYVAGVSDAVEAIVDAASSATYLKNQLACLTAPDKIPTPDHKVKVIGDLSRWAKTKLTKFATSQAASVIISQACEP